MQQATIEARVKVLSQSGSADFEVLVGMQDGSNSKWLDLFPDHILLNNTQSTYDVDMTEYHIFRMVRNGDDIRIYVDDEEVINESHVGAGESWIGFIFGAGCTLCKSEQYWDYIVFTTEGGFSPDELPSYSFRKQELASRPDPADGAIHPATWVTLSWKAGDFAVSHDVYLGASPWKGEVWCFSVPPKTAYNPNPADGAGIEDSGSVTLSWTPADNAMSHELYLGVDRDLLRSADTTSPEYKGSKALGEESYDAGLLEPDTTYYWRVDEVYNGNMVKGPVWSFTVGTYLLIDDFEGYTDFDGYQIWRTWIDGFGVADNGAQAGYLIPPYCEQIIVHDGSQSMPLLYANEASVSNSEATLTLTTLRDWTVGGVGELSLWFRGSPANAAEPMYVTISNSAGVPAVVAHDAPDAAQAPGWRQWTIPLQSFVDQGIDLSNVDKIAVGLGSRSGMVSNGGPGTVYIDDIRLSRP